MAIFRRNYQVRFCDVDCYGYATPESMINYLAETGFGQMEHTGRGLEMMVSLKEAWVISKTYMKLFKYPTWKDYIQVDTWLSSLDRRHAIRECQYYSAHRELLACATFICTLIDLEKGLSKMVNDEEIALWDVYQKKATNHVFTEFSMDGLIPRWQRQLEVNYQHLDLNGHVNNAHYLSWFLSSIPMEIHQKNQVDSFEIIYRRALSSGDKAVIRVAQSDLNTEKLVFTGQIENQFSQCATQIRVYLRERSLESAVNS